MVLGMGFLRALFGVTIIIIIAGVVSKIYL